MPSIQGYWSLPCFMPSNIYNGTGKKKLMQSLSCYLVDILNSVIFLNLVLGVVSLESSKKFSSFCTDFTASFNAMGILLTHFASVPNQKDWIRVYSYYPTIFSPQSPTFRLLFRSYSQMSARDMN